MALCNASPAEQSLLRDAQAQLSVQRRAAAEKDRQIQQHTERLLSAINERNVQVQLECELASILNEHVQGMEAQHSVLKDKHGQELRRQLTRAEEGERAALEAPLIQADLEGGGFQDACPHEELAEVDAAHKERISIEEQRFTTLREELSSAESEVQLLRQQRNSETEAEKVTYEAFLAERGASLRKQEAVSAEVQIAFSEMEALEDSRRGLDSQTKILQSELSKVAYSVGQKDHELKVKDAELLEVRQNLLGIQDEMDEVGQQLKEQCSRVQRVERELSGSRDLGHKRRLHLQKSHGGGEKVRVMRQMVQESHSGIAQLCSLFEQEREMRENCSQGLKQQRLRTELLLQLLQHFKNRTQDLAPQAILASKP